MSNWREEDNKLTAELKFSDFAQAWSFMTQVAIHAEKQGHHPEWSNVYNEVTINLTTHDEGNKVTEKDRKLASKIDEILEKYNT